MNKKDIFSKINEMDNLSDLHKMEIKEVSPNEKDRILKKFNSTFHKKSSKKRSRLLKFSSIAAAIVICSSIFILNNETIKAELENSIKNIFGLNVSDEYLNKGRENFKKIGSIPEIGDILAKSGDIFIDNNMIYSTAYISLPYRENYLYNISPQISVSDKNGNLISTGTTGFGTSFEGNTKNGRQIFLITMEADGINKLKDIEGKKLYQKVNLNIGLIDKKEALKFTNSIINSSSISEINSLSEKYDKLFSNFTNEVKSEKILASEEPLKNLKDETKTLKEPVKIEYEKYNFEINNISINKFDMQLNLFTDIKGNINSSEPINIIVENDKGEKILLQNASGSGDDKHFLKMVYKYNFNYENDIYRTFYNSKSIKIKLYKENAGDYNFEDKSDDIEFIKKNTLLLEDTIKKNNTFYINVESQDNKDINHVESADKLIAEKDVNIK